MNIEEMLERISEEAISRAATPEMSVEKFSEAVDRRASKMNAAERAVFLEAAMRFDYRAKEARELGRREAEENRYCMHFIELDCCPAGCE